MRRAFFISLSILFVLLLIAAVSMPWWLGIVLPPVAARFGASVGRYSMHGYTRFAVDHVVVRRSNVTVTVDHAEADTPLLWAWRHLSGEASPIRAGAWSVHVSKSTTPPTHHATGWVPLRTTLNRVVSVLDRWAPDSATAAGRVQWPGGGLRLESAAWRKRTLDVKALEFRGVTADATLATAGPDDPWTLSARSGANGATAALELHGAEVSGTLAWWEQTFTVTAHFAPEGWLPAEAVLQSGPVDLPGARLKLGALYASVRGYARVEWHPDRFSTVLAFNGVPLPGKSSPPLALTLRGHGDRQSLTIEALHATLPGVTADLSAPVTIERNGRLRESDARFSLRANLGAQHWVAARGMVTGEAKVARGAAGAPIVEFRLGAAQVSLGGVAIATAAAHGRFDWPRVQVDEFTATTDAGDNLAASGGWDFRTKALLAATLEGRVARSTVAAWIPPALKFDTVTVRAKAAGPLSALAHEGSAEAAGVSYGKVGPGAVAATWHARGTDVDHFSAKLTLAHAALEAAGSANRAEVQLAQLEYRSGGETQLRLAGPARVSWHPKLQVEGLHLAGPGGDVKADVVWGAVGGAQVVVHGFRSTWLGDFVPLRGPAWTVGSFALAGTWDRDQSAYSAAGEATMSLPQGRSATVALSARGSQDAIIVESLHATESGSPVVNAAAELPVRIRPGTRPLVSVNAGGKVTLDATTVSNAAFWQQLAAMTGVELRDPQVSAHLSGTWARPVGSIDFRAARLVMDPKRFTRPVPAIEGVDVRMTGDPEGVRLERFVMSIEGQAVRISGRLPLPDKGWPELVRNPTAAVQRGAQLRLEVPDAEVAMFSRFLPAALAPAGRLQADVRYDRGALGGYLRLRGAASRPLGPLGVLQQVSADIGFSNRRIDLHRITATSGGQPVVVSGTVDLPGEGWGPATEPVYDVSVKGDNLPFVRQSGLLVRGDVNLKLSTPAKGPPGISGTVTLRDSLFLSDVRSFLPRGGGASPSRRPPYFSVDTPPLDTWTLSVDVTGTRFMRLRTPVFSGVASTRFHLGGTLGAPRAIGDATVDEGQVRMPFASFDVKQGAVRLTEEDPYEPTIFLRGTGQHYGYDLTMEISGKAAAPKITFTSSPALDSEQVLLMVMTGAAPTNNVTSSPTHRAVQIGEFFGQSLLGSLTGGGDTAERLSIESGEKVSLQGKETYDIEYKLNSRWTLTGEYDEYDEYNIGLKWRIAPKKWPHEENSHAR